jgi:protoporphyrinogen oxidase
MWRRISRAAFIRGVAGAAALAATGKLVFDQGTALERIPCRLLGPSRRLGHKIRDGEITAAAAPVTLPRRKVVIVGGGIAGLSAAWWLEKQGFTNFLLLEMEKQTGGNSMCGSNEISAFPWGAHYVPIANDESSYVKMLFEELGIIEGHDHNGLPVYNELYLCHDPQERLFKDGAFQDGLVPRKGLQPEDSREIARFFEIIYDYRKRRGKDGKPAFAIPLALSSQDSEFLNLDRLSMLEWLGKNNFKSRPLLWYLNYCCRDDYGGGSDRVSAWAGLHYFAGRTGKSANSEAYSVVTWPEGNGFLVRKLQEKNKDRIVTGAAVVGIKSSATGLVTRFLRHDSGMEWAVESDLLIFAAPRYMSKCLIADYRKHDHAEHADLAYAPWMVANLSLKKLPEARGESIAWDNVSYYSTSLGYVVATHQDITTRPAASVITYYAPLTATEPVAERLKLQESAESQWRKLIVADLEKIHPGIAADILSIDLWPWGHGMVRPSVGFIWGENRKKMRESDGPIFFAHSDMSGISNFEEAQYQGVEAARNLLDRLARS